ncbi:MAG TPA: S8 family serine peptidase [Blastocatellia bacterium]|nr:S8 family serine peptidase [Blastocatellia bacterium]HNG29187.1 S8 family serine peptidase [Blastocatellia bacterium]
MSQDLCPLCGRSGRQPLPPLPPLPDVEQSLISLIQSNEPGWQPEQGLCRPCFDLFRGAHDRLKANPKIFHNHRYQILPTPLRVGADERFTGRGVTIAFLDSGFYPHPDLVKPHNRILRYVNITAPHQTEREAQDEFNQPNASSWHGMMTSVTAAGNGHLSSGTYRGLACDANVVLVKAGSAHRILHDDIRRGLEWVIEHRHQHNIRIVNLSCAGDYEESYLTDGLSQAAERAVKEGLVVVCAAGNAGNSENPAILPPASAPAVITVGGVNDRNTLELADNSPYHSSYGPTIDGLQKPEIIAPSIWVAAPILPDTPTAAEARLYHLLQETPDSELRDVLKASPGVDAQLDAAADLPVYLIRQLVSIKVHDANVISGHYKHVDGTSFAAPIVSSVVAQMLEANPRLTPQQVKRILIDTAIRLEGVEVNRQGWGTIIPSRAVERALQYR